MSVRALPAGGSRLPRLVLVLLAATHVGALAGDPVERPKGTFASSPGATIWTHAELRGVLVRESWSRIEPSPGTFDFTALRARITEVTSRGKPYSLAIGAGGPGTPAWLLDTLGAPSFDYSFRGTPMRLPYYWHPVVEERLGLLAWRLAREFGDDPSLKLVYVPQMTANGIEGHLNGIDMALFRQAGYTDDLWVEAALDTAASFAGAFPRKALAFEVHEVNGGAGVPRRILEALLAEERFGGRVGGAIWWLSGRTDYQPSLLDVLKAFRGDLYGQLIGRSDESSRFANGDYRTAFVQAMELGVRYLEPWEYDFGTGAGTANGGRDALLRDFNAWADTPDAPAATWLVPAAARAPGAGGSLFTTRLVLSNPGAAGQITLRFLGHDGDGRSGKTVSLALAAGASRTIEDVLGTAFGESEAWGAILVTSEETALVVLAETSTPLGAGSLGQVVPAFGVGDRIGEGGRFTIAAVREDERFRTNLVLASASEVQTTVDVALVDEEGVRLASKRYLLPPLGMTQATRVVRDLGLAGEISGARLVVSTGTPGASLAAYASLVDNVTNDPRTLLPR